MVGALAECRVHGLFRTPYINIEEGASAKFVGARVSCPRCGDLADIVDGVQSVNQGVLRVLVSPGWNKARLKNAQQAVAAAQYQLQQPDADERVVLEETTRRLNHAKPGLGDAVKDWCAQPGNQGLLTLITLLVAVLFGLHGMLPQGDAGGNGVDPDLVERLEQEAYRDGIRDARLTDLDARLEVLEDSAGRDEGVADESHEREASKP